MLYNADDVDGAEGATELSITARPAVNRLYGSLSDLRSPESDNDDYDQCHTVCCAGAV